MGFSALLLCRKYDVRWKVHGCFGCLYFFSVSEACSVVSLPVLSWIFKYDLYRYLSNRLVLSLMTMYSSQFPLQLVLYTPNPSLTPCPPPPTYPPARPHPPLSVCLSLSLYIYYVTWFCGSMLCWVLYFIKVWAWYIELCVIYNWMGLTWCFNLHTPQ